MASVLFPQSQFLDPQGRIAREWVIWLLNPQVVSINLQNAIGVSSGGTGLTTTPGAGQFLIGNGTGYTVGTLGAGTGITVTYGAGALSAALTNTSVAAGSYGTSARSVSVTVNAQGQITSASDALIAISNSQVSGLGTMSTQGAGAVAITGGTISGATLSSPSISGGTVASTAITGGTLDSTPIGGTTAATGKFTTLTSGAFGANGTAAQTALASGGAAPLGGTGTAAGGWDTAAHRDAAITLLNNIRTALVANGIMA